MSKRLHVLHLLKSALPALAVNPTAEQVSRQYPEAFSLDSCQRRVWVFLADDAPLQLSEGVQVFSDEAAYHFMLRVACGLESEVRGETDIFGQLKQAWLKFEKSGPEKSALSQWFQKIFEDTKEIRSLYLQNIGGTSYGSLVRKLLRSAGTPVREPILIVGAGHVARTVAPWLIEHELLICNRSHESRDSFILELRDRDPGAKIRTVGDGEGEISESLAWKSAAHAIVCIPVDAKTDPQRISYWRAGDAEHAGFARSIIHLGGLAGQCGAWEKVPNFQNLNHLFAVKKNEAESTAPFTRAEKACSERARLRFLPGTHGASASLAHGWEDLAVFE